MHRIWRLLNNHNDKKIDLDLLYRVDFTLYELSKSAIDLSKSQNKIHPRVRHETAISIGTNFNIRLFQNRQYWWSNRFIKTIQQTRTLLSSMIDN